MTENIMVTEQEAKDATQIVWDICNQAFKDGIAHQIVLDQSITKRLHDWHMRFMGDLE